MSLAKLFSFSSGSSNNQRVVGIDIGASSMKVVELMDKDDVVTLMTYGELQLGPYMDLPVGAIAVLKPEVERQALVDILRESAVKAQGAVFAMPLASSFVTTMTLSAEPKEDISPRVRVEARKYIPVPIGEVTLDWAEVDTREVVSKNARDVLLAAIQNEALTRFNSLMESVNLGKPPTEIECFSAIRALYANEEEDVAIIDLGAMATKLYIMRKGLLQRMYRTKGGGAAFTERIAKELDMSFAEAEVVKRSITRDDEEFTAIQKIHRLGIDRVLREFRQVIEEYEARSGAEVKRVYITGGGGAFPGLVHTVSEQLERSVQLAEPFRKVAYPAFMEDMMGDIGSTFSVALGAALRAFE